VQTAKVSNFSRKVASGRGDHPQRPTLGRRQRPEIAACRPPARRLPLGPARRGQAGLDAADRLLQAL